MTVLKIATMPSLIYDSLGIVHENKGTYRSTYDSLEIFKNAKTVKTAIYRKFGIVGGPMLATFRIVKVEINRDALDVTFASGGLLLVDSFAFRGPDVWRLREMLEACGMWIPRRKIRLDLNELIGMECTVGISYPHPQEISGRVM